jgi:LPS sulfotransferase NodH
MRFLDFDTGYEGKFDFPGGGRDPTTSYVLAGIPRSGSTFVSHLLWQTGCLGAPLEYLNFDGPYAFAARSTDLQQWLWQSVLRRRTSPNGVFGLKCFPMQLEVLHRHNAALLQEVLALIRRSPIVRLERRDRIAHAVSYARADMSGVWRQEQEGMFTAEAQYSADAIAAAERWIDAQRETWDRMVADLNLTTMTLWYEDAVADPAGAARQVANFVGVTLDPAAAVEVPAVKKQSGAQSADWVERYRGTIEAASTGPAAAG